MTQEECRMPGHYIQSAIASGAWMCPIVLPALPFRLVREVLCTLSRRTGQPVAAALYGTADAPVRDVLLFRDPSRTHGTPTPAECDATARALTETTGARPAPAAADLMARGDLVAMIGLRRGYDRDAHQHLPGEVTAALAADTSMAEHSWRCRAARLVSARPLANGVRWYDEPGVVITCPPNGLLTLTQIASTLGQHRFIVTHPPARTYALTRDGTTT